MSTEPKYSWIIGASAGIGAALATSLTERGETLCLSARSKDGLNQVKGALSNNKDHLVLPFDVSSQEELRNAFETLKDQWPRIDRIIFMAGIYTPTKIEEIDLEEMTKLMQINLFSVFYLLDTVLPYMKEQSTKGSHGQIAICGSVAGYAGLPNSQPYGASKAGLMNLVESLRSEVGDVIDIKLISAGFVKTRLTDKNDFDMPMRISAEEAGEIIVKGLNRRGFEIHFPKGFTYMMKILAMLPYELFFKLMKNRV